MPKIRFSVDSALLRELGERLVGKPHIALAELVKNSYDADATKVVVRFGPDHVEISDNGHGMDFREFKRFWMRIGTPHKQRERLSRYLKRPMSGSKGVGRLAVQFLGKQLQMETVSRKKPGTQLSAEVDWEKAVKAGELTKAVAEYSEDSQDASFPEDGRWGTRIIISGLNQEFTADDFKELAGAIWWLQPPFRTNPDLTTDEQKTFKVTLKSPNEEEVREFNNQMRAFLDIWNARIVGKLIGGTHSASNKIVLSLEFSDGEQIKTEYKVPSRRLRQLEFEIRIYDLRHKQPHGIKVGLAREYLKRYAGVHVYDGGFHLPYYGPDTDWLRIEIDHSHRLSVSQLLPEDLQVSGGMNFLPTQSRILGIVHVNTAKERDSKEADREDYLKIQVTRDRLADNKSFETLRKAVRWALDFYAMEEAKRAFKATEARRPVERLGDQFARVEQVLASYRNDIAETAFEKLEAEVQGAIRASEAEVEAVAGRIGLLGALATAGISALSYEHEVYKQFKLLEDISSELRKIQAPNQSIQAHLREVIGRLEEWLERARHTRALFTPLMDEENRTRRERFRARFVVDQVKEQTQVLLRGVDIETPGVDKVLRLPKGTFAEWSAIFQNVFLNAANALLDADEKRIIVSSEQQNKTRAILVQDTGAGVDLATAEELFKPFVRKLQLSPQRRSMGLGGTGLGLTIVRMIAQELNCRVAFVEPQDGFSTAFRLSWSEAQ